MTRLLRSIFICCALLTSGACKANPFNGNSEPRWEWPRPLPVWGTEAAQGKTVFLSVQDQTSLGIDRSLWTALERGLTEDRGLVVQSTASEDVDYYCQVYVRYFGPLSERIETRVTGDVVPGGRAGWYDESGTQIQVPEPLGAIALAQEGGLFAGTSRVLMVDVSVGERGGDGRPDFRQNYVRRTARLTGTIAGGDRDTAARRLVFGLTPEGDESSGESKRTIEASNRPENLDRVARLLIRGLVPPYSAGRVPTATESVPEPAASAVPETGDAPAEGVEASREDR